MKIIHLPNDVGGNAWGLAQGEKSHGLNSQVLYSYQSRFGYPSDHQLGMSYTSPRWMRAMRELKTFFRVRNRYDIFHFNGGSSLIPIRNHDLLRFLDLGWYPSTAKLFVTYQGCDARQKKCSMERTAISPCHDNACTMGLCDYGRLDEVRRRCIEKMAQHVKHMWALNPDLLHFLPKEKASFLPYTVAHYTPHFAPVATSDILTIVHAPTNRAAKGSAHIRQALEAMQRNYQHKIRVVWIENLSHQQALEAYKAADLVIDQVLMGWYGALAVECMLMGKPVIARIAKEDLHWIPKQMGHDVLKGIIHADPTTLEEVLTQAIENPAWLKRKSKEAFAYAVRWHDPHYVAALTKEKYFSP